MIEPYTAHMDGRPVHPYTSCDTEAPYVHDLIQDLNCKNATVVVEGKRDAVALTALGFDSTLMVFHMYGGFTKFADAAAKYKHVVILFDYDKKGSYMTRRLIRLLQRRTFLDLTYRRRLSKITGGRVRFIEELLRYCDI